MRLGLVEMSTAKTEACTAWIQFITCTDSWQLGLTDSAHWILADKISMSLNKEDTWICWISPCLHQTYASCWCSRHGLGTIPAVFGSWGRLWVPCCQEGACRGPFCSPTLAEWDRAGRAESLLKGSQSSTTLAPPTSDSIQGSYMPHSAAVWEGMCIVVGYQ